MVSLWCGIGHVCLSGLILRSSCHTLKIWKASLLYGSSHVSSSCLLVRMSSYTSSIWHVGPLMLHQGTWSWTTIVTLEWLLSSVDPLMFLQVASYWEALVTHWAFERLPHAPSTWSCKTLMCTWMASLLYGLVCLQVTWCWGALVTHCALEWNLSLVDPLVGFQVNRCWEVLGALEWLFSLFLQVASF